jgi:hypothetical protein
MKISRLTLYILLPIAVFILLGAFFAGTACVPPGTMPRACEQWYEKGKAEGYNTGYDEGYNRGKDAGYNDGYTQGLKEGKNLCPECPECPECPRYPEYPYSYQYYSPYNYPYFYYDYHYGYGYGDYWSGYQDAIDKFCTQCPTCVLCP